MEVEYFDSNLTGSNHVFSLNLEDMKIQQVSQGDGNYSNPVESNGTLVFMAEEYGVFGVKRQSADKMAQSKWPNLQNKDLQALSAVVSKLKQETKADFETDLLKVREQQKVGIPTMEVSPLGAPFERAGFELGFLEDKRRKVVETGILTIENNANEVKKNTKDISNSEFTNGIKSQKIENENLSEPREFSENRQSSPLQKLWDKASPSISIIME